MAVEVSAARMVLRPVVDLAGSEPRSQTLALARSQRP